MLKKKCYFRYAQQSSLSTGRDINNVKKNAEENVKVHITVLLLILSKEILLKSSGLLLKARRRLLWHYTFESEWKYC